MCAKKILDWEEYYQENQIETMPWFCPDLDQDFEKVLRDFNLSSGKVWDLGTGPGTQAMAFSELGFEVTATDLSKTAIEKAKIWAQERGHQIDFQQDNILDSKVREKFDAVFDRGCFHVLPPKKRKVYVGTVFDRLKAGGRLFLKCFSHLETMDGGPHRFKPEEITEIFKDRFGVVSVEHSIFQGTFAHRPKALFCVFEKM